MSSRFAAGGARSTVPDLLQFLRAMQAGKLLKQTSMDLMYTPARTRDGKEIGYTLGWQVLPMKDRGGIIVNDGGQQETRTFFLSDPRTGLGIAFAMNLEANVYRPIISRLFEIAAGRPLIVER